MGMYMYGIIISAVMIIAGLSGQFSGEGTGINIPLVAVGALFFAINMFLIARSKNGGDQ